MANLSLKHLYKIYENGTKAVDDFNLEIKDNEDIRSKLRKAEAKFKDENQEIKVSLLDKLAEEKKKLEELENNHQDQLNIYKSSKVLN